MPTTYDDDFGWKPRYVGKTKPVAQAQPSALDSLLAEQEAVEQKHLPELPAMSGINRDVQPVERPKKIEIRERFEAGEQQNSGETEQSRPTVGDTPSGVLDGLIRPLSAQEQANRERMYAARQGVAGLGNGLAALANVLYTGAGATPQQIPDIPDAGGQQLLSWQDRLMQDRYKQADMDLAAQREAANDAYRAWQQQMAEKEFDQNVAETKWKQNFQEAQAERDQKNIEDRNAETIRSNKANEAIRSAAAGSGSGSGSSNNFGHPLKGYGGATVNVNNTLINHDAAETAIGNEIPAKYRKEWNTAKAGAGRKTKTDVIQEAMQYSEEFQNWMIKNKYAQLSSVQDTQDDVLDFGDDEEVFNGSDFQ